MTTDYHAKYDAHLLTRRSASDCLEKLGASLLNATIDLNPHQIDAALSAFDSPLSRGAILADAAGLIVSQLWAERAHRILIICEWGRGDYSLSLASLPAAPEAASAPQAPVQSAPRPRSATSLPLDKED